MKKIWLAVLCVFCVVLSSCSLFEKKDSDDTSDDSVGDKPVEEKTTVTDIKLEDALGEPLTKSTAYQEYSSSAVYSHSDVHVIATLSDNKEKDVTSSATFSSVDLTKKGKVKVQVTYLTFTKEYELEVVENPLVDIELSLWATKLVYSVGETFDKTGLVVTGIYESGSHREITDYSMTIKNSSNVTCSTTTPFAKSDTYNITIQSGQASKTYQIGVYENSYAATETLNVTQYATSEHMSFDNTGTYTYSQRSTIFSDTNSQLAIQTTAFKNKDVNGDPISQTYQGTTYDTALELTAEEDMRLTLTEQTDLLLLVGGINGRGIAFRNTTNPDQPIYAIGNVNQVASMLYVSLPEGTYDVATTYGTLLVYNMDFNYESASSIPTPSRITVTFGYSGPNAGSLPNYTKTFDPTSDAEMRACIVLPSNNYAFAGFSNSLKNAQEGDFIKIYIDSVPANQYVVSFVGEGYEMLGYDNPVAAQSTIVFPTNPTFPPEYNGRTFLRWDVSPTTIVTRNMVVKAVFSN